MEIVVDVGRPPVLWFANDESVPANQEVLELDMEQCLTTLLAGDKKFTSDNRIGISKTLHRISALQNRADKIVGLTYRIGRHLPGVCTLIQDLIYRYEVPQFF